MKKTAYTAPALEKVELLANDVLLASGGDAPGGYEARGTLDAFDTDSAQYQRKTWADFFSY